MSYQFDADSLLPKAEVMECSILFERRPDGSIGYLSVSPKAPRPSHYTPPRKRCLSCGAMTNPAGDLPCNH